MKKYFILSAIVILAVVAVFAAEYHVNKNKNNSVKFISDAPVEDFEGKTDKIDGYIMIDRIEELTGAEMYFEVDLNSIDTGIGLRNRHMREDYLHTDKYPFTHFEGKIVESKMESKGKYKVKASGKMFIHGVTKNISVDGTVQYAEDGYRVITKFPIKLTDYEIEVPSFMFMKISEIMQLELDFFVKKA